MRKVKIGKTTFCLTWVDVEGGKKKVKVIYSQLYCGNKSVGHVDISNNGIKYKGYSKLVSGFMYKWESLNKAKESLENVTIANLEKMLEKFVP